MTQRSLRRVAVCGIAFLALTAAAAAPAHAASAKIVFSRLEAGGYHLYSARADGSGLTQLTNGPGDDTEADVSRDGRIVFSRGWATFPRGPYMQLYVRERSGSVHALFASPSQTADYYPKWSPDGRRVVFTRANPGGEISPLPNNAAVYVVDADGSGPRAITPPNGYGFATWAPDGRRVAFNGPSPAGSFVLYSMDVAVRHFVPRRVTSRDAYQPAWSPDGRFIAFTSQRDGGSWQVYVTRSDGTGQRRLTVTPGHEDKFPTWSPDGRSIAFESTRDNPCPTTGGALCRPARLYVMRADGKRQHAITTGPADSYPVWTR